MLFNILKSVITKNVLNFIFLSNCLSFLNKCLITKVVQFENLCGHIIIAWTEIYIIRNCIIFLKIDNSLPFSRRLYYLFGFFLLKGILTWMQQLLTTIVLQDYKFSISISHRHIISVLSSFDFILFHFLYFTILNNCSKKLNLKNKKLNINHTRFKYISIHLILNS